LCHGCNGYFVTTTESGSNCFNCAKVHKNGAIITNALTKGYPNPDDAIKEKAKLYKKYQKENNSN
jgi:arginine utilization protein RocB